MRIYTRTGDKGTTAVIGGRVDKDDIRVEAYGTVDELNSFTGMAHSMLDDSIYADMKEDLATIQQELFDCGHDLALAKQDLRPYRVTAEMADRLEAWIDRYDAETPDITKFIMPGGCSVSSALHVCRTVCRRAERRIVTLGKSEDINPDVLKYINRLSDLFFTLARTANFRENVEGVEYVRSGNVFRRKNK